MDEQTIQLLAQLMSSAKGGNKNLSSLMGNLDNPLLLALAGALDPYYGQQQSAGSLYSQYSSDPTTPVAVKAVMDYVDQGMNKYQIEKQVNALDLDVVNDSGYTREQLAAIGSDMSKERTKGGASDVFAKAGLRNPNEIYGVEDVPLSAGQQKQYQGFVDEAMQAEKPIGGLQYDLRRAQKKLSEADTQSAKEAAKRWVDENVQRVGGPGGQSVDPSVSIKQEIDKMSDEEVRKKYNLGPASTTEDYDAAARATARLADQRSKAMMARRKAMTVRENALGQAAASGRTPFTDQASALLRFVAGTK